MRRRVAHNRDDARSRNCAPLQVALVRKSAISLAIPPSRVALHRRVPHGRRRSAELLLNERIARSFARSTTLRRARTASSPSRCYRFTTFPTSRRASTVHGNLRERAFLAARGYSRFSDVVALRAFPRRNVVIFRVLSCSAHTSHTRWTRRRRRARDPSPSPSPRTVSVSGSVIAVYGK